MMRNALIGSAALLGLALAAPAFAQPAPSDVSPWNGLYAGLNLGYGGGNFNYPYRGTLDQAGTQPTHGSVSQSAAGIVGGVQLGYNYAMPSTGLVLGLETDFDGSNLYGSTSTFNVTQQGATAGNDVSRINYLGTVRGRVGLPIMGGRVLPYVTGGFAYGGVNPLNGPILDGASSSNVVQTGWTVGGGAEVALKRNLTMKVEYLHVDLGNAPVGVAGGSFGTVYNATATENANANLVRVGLNYHF